MKIKNGKIKWHEALLDSLLSKVKQRLPKHLQRFSKTSYQLTIIYERKKSILVFSILAKAAFQKVDAEIRYIVHCNEYEEVVRYSTRLQHKLSGYLPGIRHCSCLLVFSNNEANIKQAVVVLVYVNSNILKCLVKQAHQ